MRIALYHNLTSGGSKREAYEFARQFQRAGHTVHLFRPSTANETFLPLAPLVQRETVFPLALLPDLPLRIPGLTRYLDLAAFLINLARLRRVAIKTARAIDADAPDFAFVHHDAIVQSPYLLRHLKTPSAYYCAEPMRDFYEPPVTRPYQRPQTLLDRAQTNWYAPARWLRSRTIKSADRANIRRATLLLANSKFSADSIQRAHGLTARVSYLGVDAEKFHPQHLPRADFVLSVGAISPLKGYDFLIEAIALLPQAQRPRLVLVGNTASSAEKNFLQHLAEPRGVTLEFRVDVSEPELVCLYNQARAFVYTPIREPFGFAPLEAMACETPVVAVNEGGVKESVRDDETGLLAPRDPAEFARVLRCVLTDANLAQRLGKRGRENVLQFWTWEMAYERLMQNISTFQRSNVPTY